MINIVNKSNFTNKHYTANYNTSIEKYVKKVAKIQVKVIMIIIVKNIKILILKYCERKKNSTLISKIAVFEKFAKNL